MIKCAFSYPDCEHEGDIKAGEDIVAEALSKCGSQGKILETRWSGEDGDDCHIIFSVEENLKEKVRNTCYDLM